MRKLLLLVFFLCSAVFIYAQQKVVTGTVSGADDGESIIGATVQIKGTTIGVTTDLDGKYSIMVDEGQTLVFRFAGLETQEVVVGPGSVIDIVMRIDILNLDEVVVVAYGTQRKEARTGSVGVVKAEEMESIPVTSADKLLQGKISGLQVNNASGMPGSATEITIRGVGTINAGTEPLYVIDGIPVVSGDFTRAAQTGNVLSAISPNNIESITVLKDAAASSIYGSRAANGVILITTKSGRQGQTNFNLRAQNGFSQKTEGNFRFMTAEELLTYKRDAITNIGLDPDDTANASDPGNPVPGSNYYYPLSLLDDTFDWWDAVFQTGKIQSYELEASGGDEKTRFFTSGSYMKEEGIVIGSEYSRINFMLNVDHDISKKLTIGTRVNGAYMQWADQAGELAYANPIAAAQWIEPWILPYNDDGTFNWNIPNTGNSNPLGIIEVNDKGDKQYKFMATISLSYKILPDLELRTLNSADIIFGESRQYWHPDSPDGAPNNGYIWGGTNQNRSLTTSNTLRYTKTFANVHNVSAVAGMEIMDNVYNTYSLEGEGLGGDIPYHSNVSLNKDIDYNLSSYAFLSYFGILNYDFSNKYYFQASIRRDGSSRFGADNQYATFWSAGVSWNIHEESFMEGLSWLNMAKVRSSYGINGNASIGNYASYGVYGSRTYNGLGGMSPDNLANPDLTWEGNASFNVGLDFALFGRIQGTVEWYNRTTTDMLLDMPLSRTTGFSSLRRNIGEMKNTGIEFNFNGDILNTPDMKWNLGFNISFNDTEITDLGGEEVVADGFFRVHVLNGEGSSQYNVYDWAGVNPANGNGLWWTEDPDTGERGTLSENYNDARRFYSSKVDPDYIGGFSTLFQWKGVSLSAYFNFSAGNSVLIMERRYATSDGYSFLDNQEAGLLDYWKEPGDIVSAPKPIPWNNSNSNAWGTSRFLEDGSFLRFKNVTLSYNIPKQWAEKVYLNNARIYVNMVNVYVWHGVSYWDPERTYTGGGYVTYPIPRTITFGLDLGF
ncbi:MAG TPA: TonB-dependent receptor [Bacteroidales bacterium]|nr:TonB-dependent receptor [Bacteroidales bacterium]